MKILELILKMDFPMIMAKTAFENEITNNQNEFMEEYFVNQGRKPGRFNGISPNLSGRSFSGTEIPIKEIGRGIMGNFIPGTIAQQQGRSIHWMSTNTELQIPVN